MKFRRKPPNVGAWLECVRAPGPRLDMGGVYVVERVRQDPDGFVWVHLVGDPCSWALYHFRELPT